MNSDTSVDQAARASDWAADRRRLLGAFGALGSAVAAAPLAALAQSAFPTKAVRIVVPWPAGTSPDVIARLLQEQLQKGLGQPVIVENKPGASSIIGAQYVATSAADGHTLLYAVANTLSINPHMYKSLPYKADDFVPVIHILSVPFILVTSAQAPYRTLGDLLAAAKAKQRNMNYASYGIGQATHVAMARLLNAAGVEMVHVPFVASPIPDLMGGSVDAVFEPTTTALSLIKAAKVRPLAVSGLKRLPALPDVPTIAETFPGYVGDSWHGLVAPKSTPNDAVARLNTLVRQIIDTEDFRRRINDYGLVPVGGTPAEFQQFLADDARGWAKVLRDNNIKAE